MQSPRPHAAFLASPGMGHLTPVLELGNRLAAHHGFAVTIFVVTTDASQSLPLKSTNNLLDVILLPPVDISGLIDQNTAILTQLAIMVREALPCFRSAISDMEVPPTALFVDLFGTEAFSVADEFKMLKYVFITSNAWFLALTVHIAASNKLEEKGDLVSAPGCKPIRFRDCFEPSLDLNDQGYVEYVRIGTEIPTADGILVNTWSDLEPRTLAALHDQTKLGQAAKVPVHPIGPIVRPAEPSVDHNEVLNWLDKQPIESVVYVSFGSGGALSSKQMTELACGLETSEQRFIWVVRPPVEDTAVAVFKGRNSNDNSPDYLPEGFVSQTRGRGLIVQTLAPQAAILSHTSIGGFLSHCGWNSSLESISNGIPMIVWPLYAEQKMNAAMLTEEIGVAIGPKKSPTEEVIGRQEIEGMIRKIMVDKEGNALRAKAKAFKSSSEKALGKRGTSSGCLANVAKECEISWRLQARKALGA